MQRIILTACLLCLWPIAVFGLSTLAGDSILPDFDLQNHKVEIVIYGGTEDGCLPNPSAL
jgi:hypothetical protein